MKKHIKILVVLALVVTMTTGTVWADMALSQLKTSPSVTTGSWWSGYDKSQIVTMTTTVDNVYSEHVGLQFNMSNCVALPSGLSPSTYRQITIEVKEEDSAEGNANETVRKYKGDFKVSSGIYKINSFGTTYENPNCIETNNVVELYIRMYMDPISGDTTSTIPAGIFKYRYWVL